MMCTIIGQYQISFKHCTALLKPYSHTHQIEIESIEKKGDKKLNWRRPSPLPGRGKCTPMPRPRWLLQCIVVSIFPNGYKGSWWQLHQSIVRKHQATHGCIGEWVEHSGALGNRIPKWSNAERKDHDRSTSIPCFALHAAYLISHLLQTDWIFVDQWRAIVCYALCSWRARDNIPNAISICNIRFHSNVVRTFVIIAAAAAPTGVHLYFFFFHFSFSTYGRVLFFFFYSISCRFTHRQKPDVILILPIFFCFSTPVHCLLWQ